MAFTRRIKHETLRTISSAALTGGYDALGTPLDHPSYILKMVNDSDQSVLVSIDGSTDIDVCPAGSFFLYDEYKTQDHEGFPANTQFFVKGTAGTGTIYLINQYLLQQ